MKKIIIVLVLVILLTVSCERFDEFDSEQIIKSPNGEYDLVIVTNGGGATVAQYLNIYIVRSGKKINFFTEEIFRCKYATATGEWADDENCKINIELDGMKESIYTQTVVFKYINIDYEFVE